MEILEIVFWFVKVHGKIGKYFILSCKLICQIGRIMKKSTWSRTYILPVSNKNSSILHREKFGTTGKIQEKHRV